MTMIPASDAPRPALKIGDTGPFVLELQGHLGVLATGTFDTATDAAVRAYQAGHGLFADGVVGPRTWADILGLPPPVTVPTVPVVPQLPPINLEGIETALGAIVSALPIISTFFPPARAIVPFIPLIQGIINILKDISTAPQGDISSIVSIILKHLGDVTSALRLHQATTAQQGK